MCVWCMRVNVGMHAPQHTCGGQRITCESYFSPRYTLEIKLRWLDSDLLEADVENSAPADVPGQSTPISVLLLP